MEGRNALRQPAEAGFAFGTEKPDFGRRKLLDEQRIGYALHLILKQRLSVRKAADLLGVSHMTLYRALNHYS